MAEHHFAGNPAQGEGSGARWEPASDEPGLDEVEERRHSEHQSRKPPVSSPDEADYEQGKPGPGPPGSVDECTC